MPLFNSVQVGTIDNAHKGRMEAYLTSLLNMNPDRHMAKGAVFNGADIVMFEATRTESEGVQHLESHEMTMAAGKIP